MKERVNVNPLLFAFDNKAKMTNKENEYIYFTKDCQYVTNGKSLLLIKQDNIGLKSDISINRDNLAYALIGRKLTFEFDRQSNKESNVSIYGIFRDFQNVKYPNLLYMRNKALSLNNIKTDNYTYLFSYNLSELSKYQFTNLILQDNTLALYDSENNQYVFEDKIDFELDIIDIHFSYKMCSCLLMTNTDFYFDYKNNILLLCQKLDKIELYISTYNAA